MPNLWTVPKTWALKALLTSKDANAYMGVGGNLDYLLDQMPWVFPALTIGVSSGFGYLKAGDTVYLTGGISAPINTPVFTFPAGYLPQLDGGTDLVFMVNTLGNPARSDITTAGVLTHLVEGVVGGGNQYAEYFGICFGWA